VHQLAGSLGWDVAGSKAKDNYSKRGASREPGATFPRAAAPLAEVRGPLSTAARFIDQSKNWAAIYGV